eukprot:1154088-Pelagomonas_calceolata.AAC.1
MKTRTSDKDLSAFPPGNQERTAKKAKDVYKTPGQVDAALKVSHGRFEMASLWCSKRITAFKEL